MKFINFASSLYIYIYIRENNNKKDVLHDLEERLGCLIRDITPLFCCIFIITADGANFLLILYAQS